MSAWVFVFVGVMMWLMQQTTPISRNSTSGTLGGIFSMAAIGLIVFGIYAGMAGSVVLGGKPVIPFSFSNRTASSAAEALTYARGHLSISSHPAAAWRGTSKSELDCTIVNRGNRSLHSVTFTFVTGNTQSEQVKVRGPYPANSTKRVLIKIPDNALSIYSAKSSMSVSQISAASF